ncbi:PQQ-like beta-propeller repeat protein [Halorarum halophilum]|uniref:PQQ-like beta-propeller repeat protein n=1 Tax=Halorarum halophilum TaxID=2743090 RepID=A0A7D5GLJ5_9EURY|nr:PQQ-like beta-propeller repeat protein [Halobaculum halophilum]QLG28064.1 PQQ-like beta-propeller repeat protein [Halobaculum halophilum]
MPSRRAVLAAGAVALSTGLAGCNEAPPPESTFDASPTHWPTAGYDPAATGHAPAGPESPSVEWTVSRQSTDPPLYGYLSTPVVADGSVYVACLATRFFDPEEDSGQVVAIDAASGTVAWQYVIPNGLTGGPAIAGDVVVVGGRDGALYAVADGDRTWTVALGGQVGTPTVYGNRIYVADSRGNLHAVATDGTKHWTVDRTGLVPPLFDDPDPLAIGTPAADESGVYVAVETNDGGALLLAYDHGGSRRWRYELDGPYGSRPHGPAVGDDTVYATVGGTVHAVDAASGDRRWRFVTGAETAGPPTTDGDRVYVAAKNLYALDAADGTERWRVVNEAPIRDRDAQKLPYLARPPVADGRVYLRTGAFDATDGTRRWGDDADDWNVDGNYFPDLYGPRPIAQPVVTGDAVFLSHTHHGVRKLA